VLSNTYVRIAIFVVLVILLFYLVIALGRSAAAAEEERRPLAESERLEDAESAGASGWERR
jgi:hypothetical protein